VTHVRDTVDGIQAVVLPVVAEALLVIVRKRERSVVSD
jgi:hypothetical protein